MAVTTAARTAVPLRQDEVNRAVYYSPRAYRSYLSNLLTPPEIACLLKYRHNISGKDVLDVGVGAGRTTRYLAPPARRYEAVDYSPVMVAYMRKTRPEIGVRQADFRDLAVFASGAFDFVFATDNVIDALSHPDRMRALGEARRLLRPGGVLAFSSHNLHYRKAMGGPHLAWSWNPVRFAAHCVGYGLSWWNHCRVASLRTTTAEYALINDPGHRFACLHYYAARSTVQSQLASVGLRLIETYDSGGQVMAETKDDSEMSSLLYVAAPA